MKCENINDFFEDIQDVYDATDVFAHTESTDPMHR